MQIALYQAFSPRSVPEVFSPTMPPTPAAARKRCRGSFRRTSCADTGSLPAGVTDAPKRPGGAWSPRWSVARLCRWTGRGWPPWLAADKRARRHRRIGASVARPLYVLLSLGPSGRPFPAGRHDAPGRYAGVARNRSSMRSDGRPVQTACLEFVYAHIVANDLCQSPDETRPPSPFPRDEDFLRSV